MFYRCAQLLTSCLLLGRPWHPPSSQRDQQTQSLQRWDTEGGKALRSSQSPCRGSRTEARRALHSSQSPCQGSRTVFLCNWGPGASSKSALQTTTPRWLMDSWYPNCVSRKRHNLSFSVTVCMGILPQKLPPEPVQINGVEPPNPYQRSGSGCIACSRPHDALFMQMCVQRTPRPLKLGPIPECPLVQACFWHNAKNKSQPLFKVGVLDLIHAANSIHSFKPKMISSLVLLTPIDL